MTADFARRGLIEYKWLAMIAAAIGTFMATLDASIVNVSLPTIMTSLHTNLPTAQWVISIYLLVITGLLLTLGRLADMLGRKPIFIAGFVIFTVGSVLCGLSRAIYLLIAFRGLQALGAAMLMANSPAILADAFPGTERGKAMGMMGAVVASGLTAGPALGGFLVAAAGWPLIFFINLPIGIIGILIAQSVLRSAGPRHERHFDIPGAALLLVSLICLTLALGQAPQKGWGSSCVWILLGGFTAFGALLVARELRTAHPVLEPALFRNRLFAASSASAFIAFAAMFSVTFLMPFYLSQVLGYGPRQMGLVLTAVPLTVALVAPMSGSLSDRIGSRALSSAGLTISSVGLLLMSRLGAETGALQVIASLIVVGLGSAIFQSPNSSALIGSVPADARGVAAGMLATMRNLGMVTGVAVSGAVYASRSIHYAARLGGAEASPHAFRDAFLVAAAICALGILTSAIRGNTRS